MTNNQRKWLEGNIFSIQSYVTFEMVSISRRGVTPLFSTTSTEARHLASCVETNSSLTLLVSYVCRSLTVDTIDWGEIVNTDVTLEKVINESVELVAVAGIVETLGSELFDFDI